jgi:hypothetical protein
MGLRESVMNLAAGTPPELLPPRELMAVPAKDCHVVRMLLCGRDTGRARSAPDNSAQWQSLLPSTAQKATLRHVELCEAKGVWVCGDSNP